MSDHTDNTKEALLGELESIKDLLTEEELADIPVLDAPLNPEIETETEEDIPLLSESIEQTINNTQQDVALEEELDDLDIPILEPLPLEPTPAPTAEIDAGLSETNTPEIDASATDVSEINVSEANAPETEAPTTHADLDEAIANINIDIDLEDEPLEISEESLIPDDTDAMGETLDETLEAHIEELINQSEVESEIELSEPQHDDSTDQVTSEDILTTSDVDSENLTQEEPPLPPGVLPGQQSLFDAPTSSASDTENKEPVKDKDSKATKPAVTAKGENPFLPKHIRERLHTEKSLVDVIKESPLRTTAKSRDEHTVESLDSSKNEEKSTVSGDHIHSIVDAVVAEYLPKIEAELRARLTLLVQQNNEHKESN